MASYWIVVPRGNDELFELLTVAFKGRTGFTVIMDRRAADNRPPEDRRSKGIELGPDEIIVAECAERRAGEREGQAVSQTVRTRRAGRSTYRAGNRRRTRGITPLAASRDHRSFTF